MISALKRVLVPTFMTLLLAALFAWAVPAGSAYAVTSAEKQAEADAISVNIDALQTEINAAQARYDEANQRREEAQAAADAAKAEVERANKRIAELQDILSDRAVEMYKTGGSSSYLGFLLGASTFEDFVTALDAVNYVAVADISLVEESKTLREAASAAQAEYETQTAAAADEMAAAEQARDEVAASKAALEVELQRVNEEVVALQIKEEEERIAREEAEARARAAEEAAKNVYIETTMVDYVDTGKAASVINGWVNPIPSYYGITNPFGWAGSWDGAYHNGIDLGAAQGDPIYAAGPGTIEYTGWYGSGGNAVIVAHGDGVRTIYMHMSGFACSQGQTVAAGDLIGYVGMTGYTTGPHLHFQIEIDRTPVDPLNYYSF